MKRFNLEKIKMKEKTEKNRYSNQKGITLIALVVTIVVLLILAAISINMIMGDNGIIQKARDAANEMENAQARDLEAINELSDWLANNMDETSGGEEKIAIKDERLTSADRTTTDSPTVKAKDAKGNQIVVPGGFKIADDSGDSVQQGIVIEDNEGNQFVWVPVSNINGDGSNPIILDNEDEVEITLGRYTFATSSPGTPTLIQKGSEYDQTTIANVANGTVDTKYRVGDYYYELSDSRISNEKSDTTGTNTTAKNLADFISKTNTNKGFYIARYEASKNSTDNTKAASKSAAVWESITQGQAAIASQNMYKNNSYVESDLINSYAWDTAIVYIQAMGNTNYANATRGTNTSLRNTGTTGDEKCKIFDLAGNEFEWTTEYSTYVLSSDAIPCTRRGGHYTISGYYTRYRGYNPATCSSSYISFRPLLYVK